MARSQRRDVALGFESHNAIGSITSEYPCYVEPITVRRMEGGGGAVGCFADRPWSGVRLGWCIKLIERVVTRRLSAYLTINNLFDANQAANYIFAPVERYDQFQLYCEEM